MLIENSLIEINKIMGFADFFKNLLGGGVKEANTEETQATTEEVVEDESSDGAEAVTEDVSEEEQA